MGLREYSLQMQHLKLRFTCGGLFDINLKYFGGVKPKCSHSYNFILNYLYISDGCHYIRLYHYSDTIQNASFCSIKIHGNC